MNIALFPSAFYPSLGGVEELVRQLAHQLQQDGNRIMIATNRWPKDIPAYEEFEGLPLRRYICRVPDYNWKQMGGALLFGPGTLRQVCDDLRAHKAEIVHIQCVSSSGYYALHASRRLKLPLVVTLQGELTMDAGQVFQRSRFAQQLMRDVLREAKVITACSRNTLAEAEAFYGKAFGSRGRVIYNGVRCDEFTGEAYSHPKPYLFAIGRHVPQKGFDVLIQAFAEMVQAGEMTHDLLLAGDGTERENLKRLAEEAGLGDRVRFLGRTDREQTIQLFLGCSFFVLPSRHEPMGIVNLEAMAAGKAVVASQVGGVPELVQDGETGLLVTGGDRRALKAALTRLVTNPDLRNRLAATGHERIRAFDWPAIAARYTELYREL